MTETASGHVHVHIIMNIILVTCEYYFSGKFVPISLENLLQFAIEQHPISGFSYLLLKMIYFIYGEGERRQIVWSLSL